MIADADPARALQRWGPAAAVGAALAGAIWMTSGDLPLEARTTLMTFVLAIAAWTLAPADDLAVAGLAVAAIFLAGATGPAEIVRLLQHELIWLLAAAYIISASVRKTSLMDRLALRVAQGSRSLESLFYRLTALIVLTAFVIPATSARAAMLLPVFLGLSDAFCSARATRALSLLFPSVILLSACGVLTGAGAHLIALDMLATTSSGFRIGYLEWLVLMLPIAVISSVAATWLILRTLPPEERRARPALPRMSVPLTRREIAMLLVIGITVLLWATNELHRAGLAAVGIGAAIVLSLLSGQGLAPRTLARAVEWKLIFFLAATMLLGEALVSSGAGSWVAQSLLGRFPKAVFEAPWAMAGIVSLLALLSHLVILSRSARAAILIPVLALPLAAYGYSVVAVALLIAVGTGFCQTTRVSAKPMMIFGGVDRPSFSNRDVLKLSLALLPLVWLLLFVFVLFVWPALNVPFSSNVPPTGRE